jgi:O-acetyl-ADP-ribose deacetylase
MIPNGSFLDIVRKSVRENNAEKSLLQKKSNHERKKGMKKTKVTTQQGDITTLNVDAIVNAANTSLLGGGGVDGAIHRAAGPGLLEECRTLGGAQVGEAKITKGYKLAAKYVIHVPGPVYSRYGKKEAAALLRMCYESCLKLAHEKGVKTIAFPCISTGVYGYPKQEAAEIAVKTVRKFTENGDAGFEVVVFVTFDDADAEIYEKLLAPEEND